MAGGRPGAGGGRGRGAPGPQGPGHSDDARSRPAVAAVGGGEVPSGPVRGGAHHRGPAPRPGAAAPGRPALGPGRGGGSLRRGARAGASSGTGGGRRCAPSWSGGGRAFLLAATRSPAQRCVGCRTLRRLPAVRGAARLPEGPALAAACRWAPAPRCGGRRFEALGAAVGRLVAEAGGFLGRDAVGEAGSGRPVVVGTERDLAGLGPVDLGVVVDADGLLRAPHYRAVEDGLRLMARVAAAAGRRAGAAGPGADRRPGAPGAGRPAARATPCRSWRRRWRGAPRSASLRPGRSSWSRRPGPRKGPTPRCARRSAGRAEVHGPAERGGPGALAAPGPRPAGPPPDAAAAWCRTGGMPGPGSGWTPTRSISDGGYPHPDGTGGALAVFPIRTYPDPVLRTPAAAGDAHRRRHRPPGGRHARDDVPGARGGPGRPADRRRPAGGRLRRRRRPAAPDQPGAGGDLGVLVVRRGLPVGAGPLLAGAAPRLRPGARA